MYSYFNFFIERDWLNRISNSYAFKLDHILFIIIAMAIGIILAIFLTKKSKKTVYIVLISLYALYVLDLCIYYGFTYAQCIADPKGHPFNIETMLPFHSCTMFLYICPFALFIKNKTIKTAACNFLVVVNMIMGFITLFVGCPPVGYSALSFMGFTSLFYHAIIVIVPLIMLTTKFYDLRIKDIYYGLTLFGILSVMMWTFDHVTGCDYFYFYDGHTFPVFKFISEKVHHLVWTLIVGSCYILTAVIVHFLVVLIKYLVEKKQKKKS